MGDHGDRQLSPDGRWWGDAKLNLGRSDLAAVLAAS